MKSETDDGLSSCSNFPERPSSYELDSDKPVLPEIEHLKGKIGEGDFEKLRDLLNRNADVFSKHKADIGCCNFVEHEIELEEGAVPHREGARRMTPHKSEACRAEIEMLLEYDMIEPSKLPWACGVVMAKKKRGQLRFCCYFRYLNAVTIKDAYPIPRKDESLSKLGDAKFFTTLDSAKEGQRENRIRVRIGVVPVEEDALRLVQCNSNLSKADGSGFDRSDQKVRESLDVLRG